MYYSDIEERRGHLRLRAKLPLQYRNLERVPNPSVSCISKDISQEGVCFCCQEFIPVSTRLAVAITLKHPRLVQLKTIAKIAWIKKTSLFESYMLGLKFVTMTKEDGNFLKSFLKINLA